MRKWIAIGEQEELTAKEIATRAGVTVRTVRRWCAEVRALQTVDPFILVKEQARLSAVNHVPSEPAPPPPEFEPAFIEIIEPTKSVLPSIQVMFAGDRHRVLIDGTVDVEALVRVIAAVERC